jgi:hypothetical protein
MAITFERADTIDDTLFDSLFQTSLDDIKSGTLLYPSTLSTDDQIKEWTKEQFNYEAVSRHGILVKKDGSPINWIVGNHNPSDTFVWAWVLNGTVNGSKAVFHSAEWHTAHRTYQESIGVSKYIITCVKDSRVDTYFQRLQTDGVCLGTYTREINDDSPNNVRHCWEY